MEGLVLLLHVPEGTQDAIAKSGLPTILLGDKLGDDFPYVVPDDFGGAYAATRHLLGIGHKHIVFHVHESIRPHVSVDEREQGFRSAIDEAGSAVRGFVWRIGTEEAIDLLLVEIVRQPCLGIAMLRL